MQHGPRDEYAARRRARAEVAASRQISVDRIANARLVTVLGGIGLAVAAWQGALPQALLLAPVAVFIALVIVHERAHRALAAASRAVRYHEAGLRRLDDDWAGHGDPGEGRAPADHPYAADLDLFGRGSLYELLCSARTEPGRHTLAAWLLAPAPLPAVRARQAAVRALRDRLDLREALWLASDDAAERLSPAALLAWGEAAPASAGGLHALLAWTLPGLSAAAALAWWLAPAGAPTAWARGAFGAGVLLTWLARRAASAFVQPTQLGAARTARQLGELSRVLERLERETFDDPLLAASRRALVTEAGSAARATRGLARLVGWSEAAKSQLFAPLAFLLHWDVHFGLALERWRRRHGADLRRWLDAVGELEALLSISGFAFEHPDDPFPELDDGAPVVEGEALGHPLLPASRAVRNPVSLGGAVRARVVSGSNMSGKSTYLRTVGTNVVLALAGAPVRARRLRVSALRIGATLRVQDSLQEGTSRFFAEITRLRQVVALAEQGPGCLFLLDEILHGTNSHDRRIGGRAVVAGLLDRDAIGLVTTHDLALAAGTADPRVENVHFVDELRDGALRFDYTLHPGVVHTSNALALMQAVGLPVPAKTD